MEQKGLGINHIPRVHPELELKWPVRFRRCFSFRFSNAIRRGRSNKIEKIYANIGDVAADANANGWFVERAQLKLSRGS